MQKNYNPEIIEPEAQQYWQDNNCFVASEDSTKEKFYCLSMLPYPSGHIHMGHVRNYTIGDVIARYQRMRGKNVMQPFGWDAFGLPAENAALERKLAPAAWTYQNIAQMRATIQRLGFAIDWSRELATCTPDYYRWEQWLFLRMYEKGLVYKKKSLVNWDPIDQTVLANEQVVDGRGWRSGAIVERREISQWFLKITAYAEELLAGLFPTQAIYQDAAPINPSSLGIPQGARGASERNVLDIHEHREQACNTAETQNAPCSLNPSSLGIPQGARGASERNVLDIHEHREQACNTAETQNAPCSLNPSSLGIPQGARGASERNVLDIHEHRERACNTAETQNATGLSGWPEEVRTMQRNWIGRSEGLEFDFKLAKNMENRNATSITVFTTRADTLMGVTYLAIAPQHPLALQAAQTNSAIAEFLKKCQNIKVAEAELATMPKEGIYSGYDTIHPISGELVPIWIANFVLMEYGSGAVMSVPAHDQRDFEFAQQYELPIKPVIAPLDGSTWDYTKAAFVEKGKLINSAQFTGLTSAAACDAIATHFESKQQGKRKINYRLRDWGISRQRYWGAPIPMINCAKCGTVPVPLHDLPVVLPENVHLDNPKSPLTQLPEFLHTTCPKCGGAAERETDTFDTFMESSWYYARYCCPGQDAAMFDERVNYWMPVDQYIGGIEHAVMHLLYARFIYKVMRDEGLVKHDEPFTNLLTQGMVLKDGSKMSKSKGNTVSPQEIIDKYGVDTARLFIIFASPPEQSLEWSDSGVEGAYRFLKRLWNFACAQQQLCVDFNTKDTAISPNAADKKQRSQIYTILKQATDDIERKQLNTVVSATMKLLNFLYALTGTESESAKNAAVIYEGLKILLCILAPITPHITHHLWQELKFPGAIIDTAWPEVDAQTLEHDTCDIIVQINGKYRAKITVAKNADEETIKQAALNCDGVKRLLGTDPVKKIIIVKNKLINIVK